MFSCLSGAFGIATIPAPAGASEITFRFTNPAFGGNPLIDEFLLGTADRQNQYGESGGGGGGDFPDINFPDINVGNSGGGGDTIIIVPGGGGVVTP
ncbi:curli assembly protein CsgF [Afifella pfennigii]|uniref:curli assembly protein CsgF n=1 Tax=Afifella pfennigii TaxID=209897 RepID=UPI000691E984|nr:curli assembly protein CsgF [Afifella pfennigii]